MHINLIYFWALKTYRKLSNIFSLATITFIRRFIVSITKDKGQLLEANSVHCPIFANMESNECRACRTFHFCSFHSRVFVFFSAIYYI